MLCYFKRCKFLTSKLKYNLNLKSFYIKMSSYGNHEVHEIAKIGFAKEVQNYEKARPTYTFESLNSILEAFNVKNTNEKINVLDLAAGTGKFTRLLATQSNFNIFAVEPNEEMRKVFSVNLPNVPIYDGLSTKIPFDDGFFQIVFIAQAFHWFSNIETLREVYRVLKGQSACKTGKAGVALIWNMEDRDEESYIGELRDLYEKYDANVPQYRKNTWKNVFLNNNETKLLFYDTFTNFFKNKEIYLPLSHVWSRILSKSYIASLPDDEKDNLKAKVEEVLAKSTQYYVKRPDYNELCLHFPYYTEVTCCYSKKQ